MLASRLLRYTLARPCPSLTACRPLHYTARLLEKPLPPRRVIDENEITESFLKGTGPGGQKINKTSSAVQLKHLPTGVVVKVQGTRSREQNRKDARRLLGERLEEREKGDESRTAIKEERKRVKKASANKKTRRKYKKLAEEKAAEEGGLDEGEGEEEDIGQVASEDASATAENLHDAAEKK